VLSDNRKFARSQIASMEINVKKILQNKKK